MKKYYGLVLLLAMMAKPVFAEATISGQVPEGQNAQQIVNIIEKFLLAAMAKDAETTALYLADDAKIIFTGPRVFERPTDVGKFNATRYKSVKKDITRWDMTYEADRLIVYCIGTLYGKWLDGTDFEGDRFIDRFEIVDGKITMIEVWNDSAEMLLIKAGLAKP
ncbi:hypothetical protein [Candidatus Albibeggiatoa sp. nov. BB20]|uniref:hypothetical protein n=1 Tax=Candidatus Albibeggiatoa sp. nov. BB20 TaxID=3162723 RepID=UPI00336536A2